MNLEQVALHNQLRLINAGDLSHPIYVHGHDIKGIATDGQPIYDPKVVKDTLNLKPGEEYEVALVANNPGEWMFHCHDLHHASAGMVTEVKYKEFKSDYVPNPNIPNKPE